MYDKSHQSERAIHTDGYLLTAVMKLQVAYSFSQHTTGKHSIALHDILSIYGSVSTYDTISPPTSITSGVIGYSISIECF